MVVRRSLAAVDHTADRAVQEGMYSVVEQGEGDKGILVPGFNGLCRLLETGEHRAFAAGEVLTRIAVFADLCQHALHKAELVRHKGVGLDKFIFALVALQIRHGTVKGKEIPENRAVSVIAHTEHLLGQIRLFQDTLFDDLID